MCVQNSGFAVNVLLEVAHLTTTFYRGSSASLGRPINLQPPNSPYHSTWGAWPIMRPSSQNYSCLYCLCIVVNAVLAAQSNQVYRVQAIDVLACNSLRHTEFYEKKTDHISAPKGGGGVRVRERTKKEEI